MTSFLSYTLQNCFSFKKFSWEWCFFLCFCFIFLLRHMNKINQASSRCKGSFFVLFFFYHHLSRLFSPFLCWCTSAACRAGMTCTPFKLHIRWNICWMPRSHPVVQTFCVSFKWDKVVAMHQHSCKLMNATRNIFFLPVLHPVNGCIHFLTD